MALLRDVKDVKPQACCALLWRRAMFKLDSGHCKTVGLCACEGRWVSLQE